MKIKSAAAHIGLVTALATLTACGAGSGTQAVAVAPTPALGIGTVIPDANAQNAVRRVENLRALAAACPAPQIGSTTATCTNFELAPGVILGAGTPASQIPGYHPSDLISAYKLPSASGGKGQKLAVVVPYADPNAEADLAVYRSTFGLPPCTTANGCLQIVSQSKSMTADPTWARETATDLDMASAICPNCSLVLSQATTNLDNDLAKAVTAAVQLGATVVSNSFTVPEGPGEVNALWNHPGIVIVAAAGDQGYGTANWPAAATNVVAVGGTTLFPAPNTARGWTESVWSETGSACSASSPKPVWQIADPCTHRAVADVAAVGDPSTPVAIYNTYGDSGWNRVGGTSVATPIVAGVYALAGNGALLVGASSLYVNHSALNPIGGTTSGSCAASMSYLCAATFGYPGPSGLGSPNGIAAF